MLSYGRGGGCSVTGGYVVRDRGCRRLYGRYLYGDYCAGQLRASCRREVRREGRPETELSASRCRS